MKNPWNDNINSINTDPYLLPYLLWELGTIRKPDIALHRASATILCVDNSNANKYPECLRGKHLGISREITQFWMLQFYIIIWYKAERNVWVFWRLPTTKFTLRSHQSIDCHRRGTNYSRRKADSNTYLISSIKYTNDCILIQVFAIWEFAVRVYELIKARMYCEILILDLHIENKIERAMLNSSVSSLYLIF